MKTKGAPGPSLLNADEWRRMIRNDLYGSSSLDLRKAIAEMTKQLCVEKLDDPESISPLMACRLIPLSKNPGVRPIGIGEALRRIVRKAVIATLKDDISKCGGSIQLCAGQKSGNEIAIHSANDLFIEDDSQGLLQIDADNAFNSINRKVARQNLNIICPEFATFVTNCQQTQWTI